jgi:hypothetical protein
MFVAVCVLINLIGCTMGYVCGVTFNNEEVARQIGQLMMIIFYLLSGGLSNASAVNAFVKGIQYISPNRYSVELYFSLFVQESPALCHNATFANGTTYQFTKLIGVPVVNTSEGPIQFCPIAGT